MTSLHDFHRGRQLGPGIYDWLGELHVDEAEFIRGAGGDPANPHDVAAARIALERLAAEFGVPYTEGDFDA